MSKKQTRRSVSLNGKLYQAAADRARAGSMTITAYVEGVMMRELGIDARSLIVSEAPRSMAAFRDEVLRRREAAGTPSTGPDAKVEAAKIAMMRTPVQAQQAAIDNPCRLQGCHREGLHEAHDERPSLYNSRLG